MFYYINRSGDWLLCVATALVLTSSLPAVPAAAMPIRTYLTEGDWGQWSPDGSQIAFRRDTAASNFARHNVFVADADGSNATQITFFRGNESGGRHGTAWGPAIRPGTSRVYWRDDINTGWYFAYAETDGSTSRTRINPGGHHQVLRFSADGSQYSFAQFHPNATQRIYVGSGAPGGSYSTRLSFGSSLQIRSALDWGSDANADTLVYARKDGSGTDSLFLFDTTTNTETRLTGASVGQTADPVWSPDGYTVFFSRQADPISEAWDIWSIDTRDGTLTQWTDDDDHERWVDVAPDGQSILFSVRDDTLDTSQIAFSALYTLDLTLIPEPAVIGVFTLALPLLSRRRVRSL